MYDTNCPFCNIDPKLLLKESLHSRVLINLNQMSRTEAILIVPKTHVRNILELSTEEYSDFSQTIKEVYSTLSKQEWTKFNILINEGLLADQNVPHLHAHIFTRTEKDGIKNMRRPNRKNIFTERKPEKTETFLKRITEYFQ